MRTLTAVLVALATVVPALAHAQVQVHVDIGFRFPAPPQLVVVPQVPAVRYVPVATLPGNLFFYNGQYWAFASGGWYVSGGYNGPWIAVGPQFVPRPVLLVPVGYYHVPPGHWKKWERGHPPHWSDEWGPDWAAKRQWKSRDRDRDDDRDRRGDRDRGGDRARGGDREPKPGKGKPPGRDR